MTKKQLVCLVGWALIKECEWVGCESPWVCSDQTGTVFQCIVPQQWFSMAADNNEEYHISHLFSFFLDKVAGNEL